ncbi:MAG: type II secretion system protein GspN [Deltaproteobacteria bacterium]|nr:type II secretion system protein GspN [Deltaproteobacteria bacterium]MBN2673469.1 type II secretion system protein GspN [Deltaproteobacteria bacterium]
MIPLNLSPAQKKIIKAIGYPAFFSMCFSVFLALTFPAERFLPMAEAQLTDILGRKVTIEDLSISPFGSVTLEGVNIEVPQEDDSSPNGRSSFEESDDEDEDGDEGDQKNEDKKEVKPIAPKYYVEEMHFEVGILSLLFGDLELNVEMDFLGGHVEVSYVGPISGDKKENELTEEEAQLTPAERAALLRERRAAKVEEAEKDAESEEASDEGDEVSFSMVATGLNLIQFWDLKDFLPLPMFGQLDFGIELKTKTGKFKDAEGKMWVDGKNISLGKGQSKVEIIKDMGPMTVDAIAIRSLLLEMAVTDGKCAFKNAKLVSDDIAATAEGDIQFADPMSRSRLNLYFTFKLLEGYAQKSDKAKTLVSLMPTALSRAKRTDGSFGYAYSGIFKTAKFRPSKVFNTASDRSSRRTALRRGNRPTTSNRARAVNRAKRPATAIPSRPVPSEPPPATAPETEPESEPDPVHDDRVIAPPESGIGTASSTEIQDRQNDSQSRRMEATIKAIKEKEANEEEAAEGEEPEGEAIEENSGETEEADEAEEGDVEEE